MTDPQQYGVTCKHITVRPSEAAKQCIVFDLSVCACVSAQ